MTHPGPEHPTPAQPAAPEGAWGAAPQGAPEVQPEKKGSGKKWASVVGGLVVVLGAGYTLTGGFGIGDPKVDDCLHMKSETDFETVDCGDSGADAKVVGIEDEKLTEDEFMKDADTCVDFPTAEGAVWYQSGMITQKGKVYCVVSQ